MVLEHIADIFKAATCPKGHSHSSRSTVETLSVVLAYVSKKLVTFPLNCRQDEISYSLRNPNLMKPSLTRLLRKFFIVSSSCFTILSTRLFQARAVTRQLLVVHKILEIILHAQHLLALVKSAKALFTRLLIIVFDCRLRTMWAINCCVGNSLVRCYSSASWFKVYRETRSAFEIKNAYLLLKKKSGTSHPDLKEFDLFATLRIFFVFFLLPRTSP